MEPTVSATGWTIVGPRRGHADSNGADSLPEKDFKAKLNVLPQSAGDSATRSMTEDPRTVRES